jgi:hypothetical protein
MKTTLVLPDQVVARLKREASRRGLTMSELVEAALRLLLDRAPEAAPLPDLPTFHGGELLVDVADRDAMDDMLEQD